MNKIAALLFLIGSLHAADFDKFIAAMAQVETSGRPRVGDNGKAIGPLQIHRAYWLDAVRFDRSLGGKYEDCWKMEYAKRVVRAYLTRWVPAAIKSGDWEVCALVHNGGPRYSQMSSGYWRKINLAMK